MRPRNLAGLGEAGSPSDQARRRHAMVRRAKWPRPAERRVAAQLAKQASDLRHVQSLFELEWRKDAGQASGEHGLAGAGRSAEQQVMPTRGRNLQGAASLLLAVDLGEVMLGRFDSEIRAGTRSNVGLNRFDAYQVIHHSLEAGARYDHQAVDQGRLTSVCRWDEDALITKLAEAERCDEHAVDMADCAVQRELAQECGVRRRPLASTCERDGDGDRKIQAASFLTQLGGREIHGQSLAGKLQSAVFDRGSHGLTRFLDRGCSLPDEEELGVPVGDVRLNLDVSHVEAGGGA